MATFWNPWREGRSLPLLISMGVLFILESLVPGPSPLLGAAYVAVLVGSAWAMGRDRRQLLLTMGLLAAAAAARILFVISPGRLTHLLNQAGLILFLAYAALSIFRRAVMSPGRVGHDRISGSVCVYLMMGMIGAAMAASLDIIQPGAFRFPDPVEAHDSSAYLYFSFVTLATLGYGDITPVTPLARTFSWMLAVSGQMYVAIVVARLVSLGFSDAAGKTGRS